jgi:phosphoglycolate phosphatase-like HAD superfamily hydrolase
MKGSVIRAVAFDLDGTLVDTAPDLAAAANAMLERLGCTALPERHVARLIGGGIAACKRLDIEPHELLYVGDSRVDIAAARAERCRVAVVDYGYDEGFMLPEVRPDWTIGSLGELPALPAMQRPAKTEA